MRVSILRGEARFTFARFEGEDFITIVKTTPEAETLSRVPVKDAPGVAIKINKKSLAADGGADRLIHFIARCIREDFMMCYVNRIIDQFT